MECYFYDSIACTILQVKLLLFYTWGFFIHFSVLFSSRTFIPFLISPTERPVLCWCSVIFSWQSVRKKSTGRVIVSNAVAWIYFFSSSNIQFFPSLLPIRTTIALTVVCLNWTLCHFIWSHCHWWQLYICSQLKWIAATNALSNIALFLLSLGILCWLVCSVKSSVRPSILWN